MYRQLAVCGFAAVKALEKYHIEKINKLYFDSSRQKAFGALCSYMAKAKRPYNIVETTELEKLSESVHNQGVVAFIDIPNIPPLTRQIVDIWARQKQQSIVLDGVGNANNVGAIIRSAAFFGIQNVILQHEEAKPLITTSSYRVAQGGMEVVNLYTVKSIPTFLHDIKNRIFSIGTALDSTMDAKKLPELLHDKGFVLVLGNEEYGISHEVALACDCNVIIKGMSQMQSLNVAQAASVLFYICCKK